jgi:hypothetical protein
VRAPPGSGKPPLDAVRRRVRAVCAECATDRRSDGGVTAVRAATEDEYHGGIFVISAPSSSSIYLRWLPAPPHASRAAIPAAPPAIAAAALSSRPHSRSPPANHSTSFPRPQCTSRGHVLSKPTPSSPETRAVAATAAGRRRSPTPAAPPS